MNTHTLRNYNFVQNKKILSGRASALNISKEKESLRKETFLHQNSHVTLNSNSKMTSNNKFGKNVTTINNNFLNFIKQVNSLTKKSTNRNKNNNNTVMTLNPNFKPNLTNIKLTISNSKPKNEMSYNIATFTKDIDSLESKIKKNSDKIKEKLQNFRVVNNQNTAYGFFKNNTRPVSKGNSLYNSIQNNNYDAIRLKQIRKELSKNCHKIPTITNNSLEQPLYYETHDCIKYQMNTTSDLNEPESKKGNNKKQSTDKQDKDESGVLTYDEVRDIIVYNDFNNIEQKDRHLFYKNDYQNFMMVGQYKYAKALFNNQTKDSADKSGSTKDSSSNKKAHVTVIKNIK